MYSDSAASQDNLTDTNEEFVIADKIHKQPPVLKSIFFSIFIDTPKHFFGSIFGFFARYFKHFLQGFMFFWKPSLRVRPFDSKDFKEDAQRTFELSLIATAILLFLTKQDMIPVNEALQREYGDDIKQMGFELLIFVIFGAAYLISILISVILGRVFKLLFRISVTGKEVDILFSYLNNSLFSISLVVAFIYRCGIQFEEVADDDVFTTNVVLIYLACFLPAISLWSFRFCKFHQLVGMRRIFFLLLSVVLLTVFFTILSTAVTFFILGT